MLVGNLVESMGHARPLLHALCVVLKLNDFFIQYETSIQELGKYADVNWNIMSMLSRTADKVGTELA